MKFARFLAGVPFLVGLIVVLRIPSIGAEAGNNLPIRLYVREVPLKILGKEVKVMAIEQESGAQGFDPQTSQGFDVEVVNQLKEPTSIHWHGILLPASMDGVPYVNQEPIPPNGTMTYKFPLKQSGTYWMHSHFGLQEQTLAGLDNTQELKLTAKNPLPEKPVDRSSCLLGGSMANYGEQLTASRTPITIVSMLRKGNAWKC